MSVLNLLTEKHFQYCTTEAQSEYLKRYLECKSSEIIGVDLDVNPSTVRKSLRRIYKNAAAKGYAPDFGMNKPAPDGYKIKGTSTLYDAETGEAKIQWVKTDVDKERQEELLKEWVESFGEIIQNYKPLKKVVNKKAIDKDLLTIYPMGDPHIGMYSWASETGEDFDCDIAERNLKEAMQHLVDRSPPSETAIILNLGDFFHSDNQSNRTARAGNALDVDTRWARVLQIGISLMIDCVNMALRKHKNVIVKNNIGNHDDHTSQVLSICMIHAFKNEPRVEICEPQKAFFSYQFGKNALFSTHGHMVKPNKMQGVIANYFPKLWGELEYRLCLLGHFHHESRQEENGLVTEIFNTLASPDAWHYASGYKSKRNMKSIVLHKEYGETERFTYNIARSC